MSRPAPTAAIDLTPHVRKQTAEDLAALASDLAESVMFISERDLTLNHLTDADERELMRILTVAAKLKRLSTDLRSMTL